jgi:RimJ/RimL family protein N-acetyltransferase
METKRLIIRPIVRDDVDEMYPYMSNEKVMEYERSVFTYEELKNMLTRYEKDEVFYACILKDSNKLIGHIYLGRTFPQDFNEYTVGYIFNPAYHNQGYCTEAVKEIISYTFQIKKAHRVTVRCNPKNIASYRVMEKAGFLREGLLRKRCAFKKDENDQPIYTDELVYGVLQEDLR